MSMLLNPLSCAHADISVDIGFPGVSIGINVPTYPELVLVPGYPVYYDPRGTSNYFFYDGVYWVYQQDNWYTSNWYNGPWQLTAPEFVPRLMLVIPVRYYRQPPQYFQGWRVDAAPHWEERWGHDWEKRRAGWDRRDHRPPPLAAPLPIYQRRYSGDRYPRAVEDQRTIQSEHYRYRPRDVATRQYFQQPASPPRVRNDESQQRMPFQPRESNDQSRGDSNRQRHPPSRGRNPKFSAISPKTMHGVANTVVMKAMATAIIMNDYRLNEVSNLMSDNAPTNTFVREQTKHMDWHFASARSAERNALLNGNTRPSG